MTDEIAIPQLRWLPIAIAPRDGWTWILSSPKARDLWWGVREFRWSEEHRRWQREDIEYYADDELVGWLPMPEGGVK